MRLRFHTAVPLPVGGRLRLLLVAVLALAGGSVAHAMRADLGIADLQGPGIQARQVTLAAGSLSQPAPARIQIGMLTVGGRQFRNVSLDCGTFDPGAQRFSCRNGTLSLGAARIPVAFDYWKGGRFHLAIAPGHDESWQVDGHAGATGWQARVTLVNADPARLADWLPQLHLPRIRGRVDGTVTAAGHGAAPDVQARLTLHPGPNETWTVRGHWAAGRWQAEMTLAGARPAHLADWLPQLKLPHVAGTLDGTAALAGDRGGPRTARLDVRPSGLAVADATGLHAADQLAGRVRLAASRDPAGWQWQADVDWRGGEAYLQPLYFKAHGQRLSASGQLSDGALQVAAGRLSEPGLGAVTFSGRYDRRARRLGHWQVAGQHLALASLWRDWLQPLAGPGMHTLALSGRADLALGGDATRLARADARLYGAGVSDPTRRIALGPIDGVIPWRADAPTIAAVQLAGGNWQGLPVGKTDLTVRMQGLDFAADQVVVPLFDGGLDLHQLRLSKTANGWTGAFAADIRPISMARLSSALGWPKMQGTLAGSVPRVRFKDDVLKMDGAIGVHVFDGDIGINGLEVDHPLGARSILQANADLRHIDLGLLTRAFSFGSIEGRLDGDIEHLELVRWKPVQFDARLASSPGHYRKRISQQAVNNITSLSGGGAMAGLQRSFLRFFKQFSYDRIGLSGRLRDGVCVMNGISDRGNNAFVIVQGGGVPAITVLGFNHDVDWNDLVGRVADVIQSNAHPVIN